MNELFWLDQGLQFAGAVLVLLGYALTQYKVIPTHSKLYLWLNILGAGFLAIVALYQQNWGFVLLEISWTGISLWSLIRFKPLILE
jgi:mannose/fructose/N-acetylgalactosamine-specific phosphotransferase system component IIC